MEIILLVQTQNNLPALIQCKPVRRRLTYSVRAEEDYVSQDRHAIEKEKKNVYFALKYFNNVSSDLTSTTSSYKRQMGSLALHPLRV